MQRFSTKYWQTEFNTSKRSYTMIKVASFQECKDGSTYVNLYICNIAYKQKQGPKPHDPLNRHRKSL
jgi:hypothetical protein